MGNETPKSTTTPNELTPEQKTLFEAVKATLGLVALVYDSGRAVIANKSNPNNGTSEKSDQ